MDHGNNQTRSAIPQATWCQLNRGRIRRLLGWYIAARPSAWKKELSISENFGGELGQALVECVNVKRQLEHAKASVRCSIEWCFLWLKRIYGYAKVRYRGLAKNTVERSRCLLSTTATACANGALRQGYLADYPETLVRASSRVPWGLADS